MDKININILTYPSVDVLSVRILPQKDVVEGQENCTKGDGEHVQNHGEDSAVEKFRVKTTRQLFCS